MHYDVIVVGGGLSGGLPAAAYLQKAGASVLVLEAAPQCGNFFRSYERAPGVLFDVAPVNFSRISPVLADLQLQSFGYEIDIPGISFSTMDGQGRTTTFFPDPGVTAERLGEYSAADADRYIQIMRRLDERARRIYSAVFFTPFPDIEQAIDLSADVLEIDEEKLLNLNAPQLVEKLFQSEPVRLSLMALPAVNLFGDLLERGQGALCWLWTFLLRACRASGGGSSLVDALEKCLLHWNGTIHTNARVTRFILDGYGVCQGVRAVIDGGKEQVITARAIISNLGASLTSDLLGRSLRPNWHTAGRTVLTADAVLDRPVSWADRDMENSPRVYLIWDTWEACLNWLKGARDEREDTFLGHIELTQFNVLYGTGGGGCPLRIRFGTGPYLDDQWPAREGYYEEEARKLLGSFDPDLSVLSIDINTPLDYWQMNPAAVNGNPVGGDFIAEQWVGGRLDYRTPVKNLYASNSVWPTSLSWMASGYNAASVVAEDLGLREQPWWVSPPVPDFRST